jgi:hypothetical protein
VIGGVPQAVEAQCRDCFGSSRSQWSAIARVPEQRAIAPTMLPAATSPPPVRHVAASGPAIQLSNVNPCFIRYREAVVHGALIGDVGRSDVLQVPLDGTPLKCGIMVETRILFR